ncbi:MAG: FHA domain-containing protein [Gammaproteobacteria bacterium]
MVGPPEKPDESRGAQDEATVVYTGPFDAQSSPPKAELVCLEMLDERFKGLRIPLVDSEQTIGRDSENTICVEYSKISRRHARVLPGRGVWEIEDLKSTNGVYVNEERITRAPLKLGDIVRIGPLSFRYALEQAPTSHADSPLGAGGTMYAGHPAVAAFLTPQEKSDEVLRQAPPRPSPREPQGIPASGLRKENFPLRYLLALLLASGLAVGGYLYSRHLDEKEIEALVAEYSTSIRKFLDNYEGDGLPFSKQSQEEELDAIRNIAARVDLATGQHPASLQLKELQARLLFLAFERKLQALLTEGRLEDALERVEDIKANVPALSGRDASRGDHRNGVEEVSDLLELAVVIVKFKQFRQRFPDPASSGFDKPAPYYLREMQILKDELVRHKKENHLPLSVTYTYFQRMVTDVEENDLRLLNRWKDALKQQSP